MNILKNDIFRFFSIGFAAGAVLVFGIGTQAMAAAPSAPVSAIHAAVR